MFIAVSVGHDSASKVLPEGMKSWSDILPAAEVGQTEGLIHTRAHVHAQTHTHIHAHTHTHTYMHTHTLMLLSL